MFVLTRFYCTGIYTCLTAYCLDSDCYKDWDSNFNVEEFKERISELLVENSEVKKMHSKLVSSKLQ